jgi:hypothetical protein
MSYTQADLVHIIESGFPISIEELIAITNDLGNASIVLKTVVDSGITSNLPDVYVTWIQEWLLPGSLCVLKHAGYQFSNKELGTFLSYPLWIEFYAHSYTTAIQLLFKDNSIMLRKWERYAENVRSLL